MAQAKVGYAVEAAASALSFFHISVVVMHTLLIFVSSCLLGFVFVRVSSP